MKEEQANGRIGNVASDRLVRRRVRPL